MFCSPSSVARSDGLWKLCVITRDRRFLFARIAGALSGFGMDIVAASVLRAQEQGYGAELNPQHTAAAIALLFENFTTVFVGQSGLGMEISDEDAIATLSTVWKKTLYGV